VAEDPALLSVHKRLRQLQNTKIGGVRIEVVKHVDAQAADELGGRRHLLLRRIDDVQPRVAAGGVVPRREPGKSNAGAIHAGVLVSTGGAYPKASMSSR
jgi:hypothetical protein